MLTGIASRRISRENQRSFEQRYGFQRCAPRAWNPVVECNTAKWMEGRFALGANFLSEAGRRRVNKRLYRVKDWSAVAIACGFQLEAMAKKYDVSQRTLRRHFQRQFGVRLKVWVDVKRVGIAAEYLSKGSLVKTTAADLNFTQRSQFSKFFKRLTGSAPTNYGESS